MPVLVKFIPGDIVWPLIHVDGWPLWVAPGPAKVERAAVDGEGKVYMRCTPCGRVDVTTEGAEDVAQDNAFKTQRQAEIVARRRNKVEPVMKAIEGDPVDGDCKVPSGDKEYPF